MNLPVIVIGGGGHARVLISVLKALNLNILGVTEFAADRRGGAVEGIPVLGGDELIYDYCPAEVRLVNGVGSISIPCKRREVYTHFKQAGFTFATLIHPTAVVVDGVRLGEGVQIMAGAVIQAGCSIGDNTLINTGALVDHDCRIGAHVHVATGSVLSGGVRVGDTVHLGTSSSVIQGIEIGSETLVAAGAVVTVPIPSGVEAIGVPARIKEERG